MFTNFPRKETVHKPTNSLIFSFFNMGPLMYFYIYCFCLLRVGKQ